MNHIWNVTGDDYIEVVRISKELGIKPGESMEEVFVAYMNIKGKKPMGATELSKEELVKEYLSHDKKILEMNVNVEGKTTYKIIKNKSPLDK